ncbi:MAG: hypothetical protein Q7R95_06750 [bacterium]|nr:hypothetical protein [bacterium]
MNLPKELTTVTALSKKIALIMFVALPIIAFLFGMKYQQIISFSYKLPLLSSPSKNIVSTIIPSLPLTPSQTSQDETANWKIFTSQYGFTLKYPSGWFSKDLTSASKNNPAIKSSIYFNDKSTVDFANYKVSFTIQDVSLEKAKFFLNYSDAGNEIKSILTESSIEEVSIIQAVNDTKEFGKSTGTHYTVLIPIKDLTLTIYAEKIEDKNTVNQILSTFKFLDQNQATNTSNWKTYINKPTGLNLSYPTTYPLIRDGINQQDSSCNYIELLSNDKVDISQSNNELSLSINICNTKSNDSLESFYQEQIGMPIQISNKLTKTYGDISAISYQWKNNTGQGNGETVLMIANNKRITVYKYPLQTTKQQEFEQILSSVKIQ